jgi:hypothetical protein
MNSEYALVDKKKLTTIFNAFSKFSSSYVVTKHFIILNEFAAESVKSGAS